MAATRHDQVPGACKANGTLVMEFKRTMLNPKRGHSIEGRIEAATSVEV